MCNKHKRELSKWKVSFLWHFRSHYRNKWWTQPESPLHTHSLLSVATQNKPRQFIHRCETDKGKIKAYHCRNKSVSGKKTSKEDSFMPNKYQYRQRTPKQSVTGCHQPDKDFDKLTALFCRSSVSTKETNICKINDFILISQTERRPFNSNRSPSTAHWEHKHRKRAYEDVNKVSYNEMNLLQNHRAA